MRLSTELQPSYPLMRRFSIICIILKLTIKYRGVSEDVEYTYREELMASESNIFYYLSTYLLSR